MSGLNYEAELFNNTGTLTKLVVRKVDYGYVEVTFSKKLTGDNGKVITDSSYTMFYDERQFKDFFQPLVNELKVRFDNDEFSKIAG